MRDLKRKRVNKRLTVLHVAKEMGIKRRQVITRAGRMLIERVREEKNQDLISSVSQYESWGKKKQEFKVASYPYYFKSLIVQMLTASAIIQKNVDKS